LAIFNALVLYSLNESFIGIWVGSENYIGHAVNAIIIFMSYIYDLFRLIRSILFLFFDCA
jgi:hypothetical protein